MNLISLLIKPVYADIKNPLLPNLDSYIDTPIPFVTQIVQTILGLFFILAVIYFAWQVIMSGLEYMNSQGDPKRIEIAKNQITNAFMGLGIIFLVFVILKIIGVVFGITSLENLIISVPTL